MLSAASLAIGYTCININSWITGKHDCIECSTGALGLERYGIEKFLDEQKYAVFEWVSVVESFASFTFQITQVFHGNNKQVWRPLEIAYIRR